MKLLGTIALIIIWGLLLCIALSYKASMVKVVLPILVALGIGYLLVWSIKLLSK